MATYTFDKIEYGSDTYVVSDSGALQLTGGQVTGPVTFGDSISVDEATLGDLVVNGNASFTNNVNLNKLNNVAAGNTVEYIVGTQAASTNLWTGVTKDSALYDGKMIIYVLPYAGTSTAATLNLTLANGTTTGAKGVFRYGGTTGITTHYAALSRIFLIYDAANNRWNSSAWYYSDSNTVDRLRDSYFRPYAGEAVYRYKFVMQGADNRMYPITVTNQEDATQVAKVPTQVGLRPGRIWYYNTTATVAAGGLFAANTLDEAYQTTVGAYNFNTEIATYRMLYLRGTYNKTTDLFTLYKDSSSPCTSYYTQVPTNTANITLSSYFTSGYYYLLVGGTYSTANYISLFVNNPLYYFDGTNLIPVSTKVAQDTNTDEKVTQTPTSGLDDANYEFLLSGTADNTTRTEGVKKAGSIVFNPSTRVLEIGGYLYSHRSQMDGDVSSSIYQGISGITLSTSDERDQDDEKSSSLVLGNGFKLTNKSDIYDEDDRYVVNNTITATDYFKIESTYKVNDNTAITTQLLMENGEFEIYRSGALYIRINSSGLALRNLISPTNNTDAATKKYVDDNIATRINTAGTGLSKSGTTLNHSNSITAQTTQAIYPIKIDAQGHISAYGSAVTIPSITLNGSSTTSASFYAPTTVGTNGYVLKSNGSGAPTWTSATLTDTQVTTAALTSGTLYYPILATGTGTATRQIDSTLAGLTYKSTAGTTSAVGTAQLTLGNNIANGTANNEHGQLIFYGKNNKKVTIFADTPYEDVEITLPSTTGTLATRDLASIYDRGLMSSADKIKLDGISVNAAAVKIVRW